MEMEMAVSSSDAKILFFSDVFTERRGRTRKGYFGYLMLDCQQKTCIKVNFCLV